uniref:Procollagen-proline 4-dioxygenase n=1 Tax=Rhabditophanes sp. KR3021 TaxID=114890 RepID=A0AC35TZT5_9BILA
MKQLLFLTISAIIFASAKCDLFTAMVDLENLKAGEKLVGEHIENYIASEEKRIDKLKELAKEYSSRTIDNKDISYITNPVNAYTLIKKMSNDWTIIQTLMNDNKAEHFIKEVKDQRAAKTIKYPGEEDFNGAALALIRLQETYNLSTTDLADGIILGNNVNKLLTAHDCFEIARSAYNDADYYHCIKWIQESMNRWENEATKTIEYTELLEYMAFSLYKQGNVKRALAMTKKLAALDPAHPRTKGNLKWYEEMLSEEEKMDSVLPPLKNERPTFKMIPEQTVYESLCRGENTPDIKMLSKVYCYYKRDLPFLKLAPIKVEIVRFKPLAVLFRGVISDHEIKIIQEMATPRLKRATVQNAKTGALETASYRISKSAWLKDQEHPVINRINKRIGLMTNLNQATSEDLQIANYGIGGHYDPHFDFARKEETNAFKRLGTGNRIATVLFYMSQPEQGGATVFTELDMPNFPQHHDALFWYNLKRNGEGDERTRHAACPVLTGVKWVSNKWIHEIGQEFTRPCGLTEGVEENFVGDLSPF